MSRPGFKANLSGWKPRLLLRLNVELVPFPVIFITKVLVLGKGLAAPYILPKRGTALSTSTTRSLNSSRWMFC